MNKSKKIFAGFALIYVLLLAYASYDISRKTTFPGSRPQLKERLKEHLITADTVKLDSSQQNSAPTY
jgi:hypothetical protein